MALKFLSPSGQTSSLVIQINFQSNVPNWFLKRKSDMCSTWLERKPTPRLSTAQRVTWHVLAYGL